MVHAIIEIDIPMKAETYWKIRQSRKFEKIQCEFLDLQYRTYERSDKTNTSLTKIFKTKPNFKFPAAFEKIVPNLNKRFIIEDHIIYDLTSDEFVINCISKTNVWKECNIKSKISLIVVNDYNCKQRLELDADIIAPLGIGKKVENGLIRKLKENYEKIPHIIIRYLAEEQEEFTKIFNSTERIIEL